MSEESKTEALETIQNIVLTLMKEPMNKELEEGLSLIESICRHGTDVSNTHEKEKYKYTG